MIKTQDDTANLQRQRLEILIKIDELREQRCVNCKDDAPFNNNSFICDCEASKEILKLGEILNVLVSPRKEIAKSPAKINETGMTLHELTEEKYHQLKLEGLTDVEVAEYLGTRRPAVNKWKRKNNVSARGAKLK